MTTPVPKCSHCHDTGNLTKTLEHGHLDCGHCDAAEKRRDLEEWCRRNIPPFFSRSAAAWLIYQHGHAASLTEAELVG